MHQTETGRKADVQLVGSSREAQESPRASTGVDPGATAKRVAAILKRDSSERSEASCPSVPWPKFEVAYPAVLRAARVHAARVTRSYGLPRDEQEDLIQEAMIACWRKLPIFDPARASLATFVGRLIAAQMLSSIRTRLTTKRGLDVCQSLSCIQHEPAAGGTGPALRIDVLRTLGRLPVGARRVVLMLGDAGPAVVSRETGLSRAKVYRIRQTARAMFVEAGIHPGGRSATALGGGR